MSDQDNWNWHEKTGGMAFPTLDNPGSGLALREPGMTLRDYFAAKFCAAMVSTIRNDGDYMRLRGIAEGHDLDSVSQFFAKESYKQADAMLVTARGARTVDLIAIETQINTLLDIGERHARFTKDDDERTYTEGALKHVRAALAVAGIKGAEAPP